MRYSDDLRERVIDYVLCGHTTRAAALLYKVSEKTARRWRDVYLTRQTKAALPVGGDKRSVIVGERALWLLSYVEAHNDATLEDYRAALLTQFGFSISMGSLWSFLNKRGLTYKKNASRRRTTSS